MSRIRFAVVASFLLSVSPAIAQMGPVTVVVAPVVRQPVELTEQLVATVEPVTRTTVASEQEGIVSERLFDEGEHVERGQVLAKINTDILQQQHDAAAASLKAAENELASAKLWAENYAKERHRLDDLIKNKAIPEKAYDEAVTQDLTAQSTVAIREADVAERKAELANLRLQLEKSQVKSPISGVVASRNVEAGQWLEKGSAVADIVQLDPLFVRVAVPEAIVPHTERGAKAKVIIDALNNAVLEGVVDQILPEADPNTRTVPVKLKLDNPKLTIRPGFFARATLLARDQASLLVPKDAVVPGDEGSRVVVVRELMSPPGAPPGTPASGKSAIVPVTRMHGIGNNVFVKGDLQENDLVIIRGNEALRGGEDLMILNPPAAAGAPGGPQQPKQEQRAEVK